MSKVHVVFMVSDMQTYHEWISLFPGLETKCDVMFMDDLSKEGFSHLTKTYLERSKMEEDVTEEEKKHLVNSLVLAKEKVKDQIFQVFYNAEVKSPGRLMFKEFFNGRGVETVFPDDRKANFYMLENGAFKVYDPMLKQIDYNLRAELTLVQMSGYIMYLEVFRFLYDFLSLNLSIRKNYY